MPSRRRTVTADTRMRPTPVTGSSSSAVRTSCPRHPCSVASHRHAHPDSPFASASTTGTATARARTGWPGNVFGDTDDLVALVDKLGLAPALIAGDSGGVAVVLRTTTRAMVAAGVVADLGRHGVAFRSAGGARRRERRPDARARPRDLSAHHWTPTTNPPPQSHVFWAVASRW